ncbi:MAG: PDZ domain-containing protein [Planctomycetota bacterium]|nr:PDZ domain-containing protein [Planctomycetota bacterium]
MPLTHSHLRTLALAAAVALVAPASASPSELGDLLPRLDAGTWAEREQASDALLSLVRGAGIPPAEMREAVVEALRTGELSLEQRVRLMSALRRAFALSPRGALGVRFSDNPAAGGVAVMQVVAGFPARDLNLLRDGDFVTHADGISLSQGLNLEMDANGQLGRSLFRRIIISHDPGEEILLRVVRRLVQPDQALPAPPEGELQPPGTELVTMGPGKNAEILDIRVPLGSFESLRETMPIPGAEYEDAWRLRMHRLGIPLIEAQRVHESESLDASDWTANMRPLRNIPPLASGSRLSGDAVEMLAIGGAIARNDGFGRVRVLREAQPVIRFDPKDQMKPIQRIREVIFPGGQRIEGPAATEIADLQRAFVAMQQQAALQFARAQDPQLPKAEREKARQEAEMTARLVADIQNKITERRAQAARQAAGEHAGAENQQEP